MAMNKDQVIEMYEKMRATALRLKGSFKGRQSFGQMVLSEKGVLSWAKACSKLYGCTPPLPPLQPVRTPTNREIDMSDELKNILTLMALSAIEGAGHVNVNGV
jgi:hypothetical protein